jgi:uncharacterized protein YcbX
MTQPLARHLEAVVDEGLFAARGRNRQSLPERPLGETPVSASGPHVWHQTAVGPEAEGHGMDPTETGCLPERQPTVERWARWNGLGHRRLKISVNLSGARGVSSQIEDVVKAVESFCYPVSSRRDEVSMAITVTELYRYPIKSCRGEALAKATLDSRGIVGDRQFMVVDEDGLFLTQREVARLCQLDPLVHEGGLTLRAPDTPSLTIPVRRAGSDCTVTIWDDRCRATDQGDHAALWLERLLRVPVRLVRLADDFVRPVDPAYALRPTDQVHFGDGFPLLLINQASLDDLNGRMEAALPMNRFRPNIVVAGAPAYAEDHWRTLRIGAIVFDVVKPCSRCAITQIDQASAVQGKEPLRTLAGYRMTAEKKMLFGQYLVHAEPGTICIGDRVDVLAEG